MNKKVLVATVAVLAAISTAFADDLFPPPWRGEEGSTFQEWDFSTDDTTPLPDPDTLYNPYGAPLLRVNPMGDWINVIGERQGVWPLSGEIDMYIPNWPEPRPKKEIWIQLTWKATDVDPFLPNEPVVGVTSYPLFEFMEMSRQDQDLGNGWVHTLFVINLHPNPFEEWITIKGDIVVDQLVIDTYCNSASSQSAFTDNVFPPPWRGQEGSSFQEWTFSANNTTPFPDNVQNPYGVPLLRVSSIGDWIPDPGAWPLSGEIDVYIPNWPVLRPEKEIWIQLTWKATDVDPFLPNEPLIGVAPFESMVISRTDLVDFVPDWNHSVFKINLYPNPFEEWITIKGDILVDQLTIDTYCIPESFNCDNYADLGDPEDEVFHNLQGWGSAQGPPENPYVSPSGDQTKRYQLLRQENSVDLFIDEAGISYLLVAEVEDGSCTDNFEIYVNGQGPVYQYTGANVGTPDTTIVRHEVVVPDCYVGSTTITITFKNMSTDDCGLGAVFNIRLIPYPRICPCKAAELAKQVVGAPYLGDGINWGGKGFNCWACPPKRFVDPNEIKTLGYCYYDRRIDDCNPVKAAGLDCSGLVFWAYNRAYFGNKELTGKDMQNAPIPFYCDGAGGQYEYSSYEIEREELLPGDLLFLVGHVAMYVGENKVIHAKDHKDGIVEENLETFLFVYHDRFKGFQRVKDAKAAEILITDHSPIDLIVTDPDGITITKELWEAPGMYYRQYDIDDDGEPDDIVAVPKRKIGSYLIEVVPEPNALPNDTYSLQATINGQTMVLAEDVPIEDIPAEPYEFESKLNRSDFDSDGDVDFADYAVLANRWMNQDCNYPDWCGGTDLDYSGVVDVTDLDIFAENWLWKKIPADLNIDGNVDFIDYAAFASEWMDVGCNSPTWCDGADLNKSGSVDLYDLKEFTDNWLAGL